MSHYFLDILYLCVLVLAVAGLGVLVHRLLALQESAEKPADLALLLSLALRLGIVLYIGIMLFFFLIILFFVIYRVLNVVLFLVVRAVTDGLLWGHLDGGQRGLDLFPKTQKD